ncbi:MAG: hypothetical protein WCE66_04450, partial [Azonexus sp.]
MSPPENFRIQWSLRLALLLSLIAHGVILALPTQSPRVEERAATRLEASLVQKPRTPPKPATPAVVPAPATVRQVKPQPQRKILALDKAPDRAATTVAPRWSVAQKEEMNSFLRELDGQA